MSRRVDALRALAERGATAGERKAARVALGVHTTPRRAPAPAPAAAPTPPPPAGDFAQPYKLSSGAWGVLVRWPVELGDVVTVRARDGRTWSARISTIEATRRNGTTICSVDDTKRPSSRHSEIQNEVRDALRASRAAMRDMTSAERRRHLDALIAGIIGRPPSPT